MIPTNLRARAEALRAFLFCLLPITVAANAAPEPDTRPNFVIIMTDDQRLEELRVMRKTRALIGRRGTTFSNSFVTFPLCCPSRATSLTGQYAHNHGVLWNMPPTGGYTALDHANTLPVWLQKAGYFTSHIGKYMNGYGIDSPTEVPPGWSDWQGLVGRSTYRMYNYTINDNGRLVTYGKAEEDYQTDVLADRAEDTVTRAVSHQPFFLNIAPLAPHDEPSRLTAPWNPRPAPRHLLAFADRPLPQRPSFGEEDVSDKPASIQILPRLISSRDIAARSRSRLASLLAVDDLVERVVKSLRSAGVLDHTVLIFTSDNGYFLGEHRIAYGKLKVYDESIRVPLLVRGGGFPEGVTATQLVANVDLAPTIIQLAGATARLTMDGQPLLPLARDPNRGLDRDLLIESRDLVETAKYSAVRNESFLYVEHSSGERELYDMRRGTANYDPYQLNSRHSDKAYRRIKARLAAKLDNLRTCSGRSCRTQSGNL